MKKLLFSFLVLMMIFLQSCSIKTTSVYHKDAAQSIQMDIDMKEFIEFTAAMDKNADGTSQPRKTPESFEKVSKDWKSLYEIQKDEGKSLPKDEDSIKLLKRIFMKGMFDSKNAFQGISMKMDRITREEVKHYAQKFSEKKSPMLDNGFNNWDGKKLIINTDDMSLQKGFSEMMNEMNSKKEKKPAANETEKKIEEAADKMKDLFKMIDMKLLTTLKFESKIKSIIGKHDFIKQVDDYTVQISFNTKNAEEQLKALKNKDKTIIIETE